MIFQEDGFFARWGRPLALIFLGLCVYWQTLSFGFVGFDDYWALKHNPGLYKWKSWAFLPWALTTFTLGDWQPLTWISFAVNYQLHGLEPQGYHWVNVGLHIANSLLLFHVMKRMTGKVNVSFVIAAFFAVHPQHVESVAWISERKDVLSAFFWLLTMNAYLRYAATIREPRTENHEKNLRNSLLSRHAARGTWFYYILTLIFFALGIMSKPTVVTLPFVLLLLDFWPLGRLSDWKRCLIEKVPFFALVLFSCFMTLAAVSDAQIGAVKSLEMYPFYERLLNGALSYATYILKTVVPYPLYLLYPYPESFPLWKVGLSVLFLGAISVYTWIQRKTKPYLIVGWLWFLGVLVPMIGLIQAGSQSMADRYMYLPHIGLLMAGILFAGDLMKPLPKKGVVFITTLLIAIFTFLGWKQSLIWQNTETLYNHSLKYEPRNFDIQEGLCDHYFDRKEYGRALEHCEKALAIRPDRGIVHWDIGRIKLKQKKFLEASRSFHTYFDLILSKYYSSSEVTEKKKTLHQLLSHLAKNPNGPEAYKRLGDFWIELEYFYLATDALLDALKIDPQNIEIMTNLANVLFLRGRFDSAKQYYQKVLKLDPDHYRAHFNYGLFLTAKGDLKAAEVQYQKLESLKPGSDAMKAQLQFAMDRER